MDVFAETLAGRVVRASIATLDVFLVLHPHRSRPSDGLVAPVFLFLLVSFIILAFSLIVIGE